MKYSEQYSFNLPEPQDSVDVEKLSQNFNRLDMMLYGINVESKFWELSDDMPENVDGFVTPGAVVGYVKNKVTSGGGKKWQHLTTIEFEAEAQQFLSDKYTESDGIKGVFVKVFIPIASATANFMVRLLDAANNEVTRVQPQGYVSTTNNTYGQAKLELVDGLWDGWWTAAVQANNNAWTAKYGLRYMDAGKTESDLPFVSRIIIGAINEQTLPVGTKMEVWVLK